MIMKLDPVACGQEEAVCALECLKHVKKSASDINVMGPAEDCQANCGISAGQCMIMKLDPVACGQEEGVCALECLKKKSQMSVKKTSVKGPAEDCQANCGISAGQCMIMKLDPVQCGREEGVCALECLKTLKVQTSAYKTAV
jgi:hypothetical protein